jgi:hypothetical protein
MNLQNEIIYAFNLNGEIEPLSGGQNTSVKVKNFVLKPVDNNVQYYEWLLNIINELNPHGYRVSKPVRNNTGTFVYKDWGCTHYEPGKHREGNIKEKLKVARMFHSDLASKSFSDIPRTEDPWSKSHRIAWQREKLPMSLSKLAVRILGELLSKLRLKDDYKVQIVHSDLSGNILFDEVLDPLVIDFSPTIAPAEYAEAILVCDSIAWQGSSTSEIELICHSEFSIEMILRAIVFRLSVAAIFAGNNDDEFIMEYQNFKPIIDYLN